MQTLFQKKAESLGPMPDWWAPLIAIVDQEMAQDSGHDWGHLIRVLSNAHALLIKEGSPLPWPPLAVAVALHDIVNLPKNHPDRKLTSTRCADRAVEILTDLKALTPQVHQDIHDAIRCHSFSSGFTAEGILGQLLSDADRLDALGAIGLARMFATGGALKTSICHPTDPFGDDRSLNDMTWSLDHIRVKLLTLKDRMYTQTGREMATQREEFLVQFQTQMVKEITGGR